MKCYILLHMIITCSREQDKMVYGKFKFRFLYLYLWVNLFCS